MKSRLVSCWLFGSAAMLMPLPSFAQPATEKPAAEKPAARPVNKDTKDHSNSSIVTRMMAFDKNGDGKVTKEEVTDPRLHRLFQRADANNDGIVTKEELAAVAAKIEEEDNAQPAGFGGPGGGGGPGGFGGPGGPGGFGPGPGGPGGPGGFGRPMGGPPMPGQVLPPPVQQMLNLSPDQKKQLDELQKQVDEKIASILNEDQKKQLHDLRNRGPRFGPPGGQQPPPPPAERRAPQEQ
jgi:hypothetical protein